MINQPKTMYLIYLKQNSVYILISTLLFLSLFMMMEGCFEGSKSQCSLLQQSGCTSQQFCALDFAGQEQCVPKKDTFTPLGSPCTLFDECGPQHGCFKHFGVSLCLPFCDLNQSQQTCPTLNTEQATWSQFGECILSIDDFNSVGLCTYPCQPGSTQDGYASCSWEESPSQCRFVPNLSFSVCTSSLSELGLDSTQNRQQTRTRFETCSQDQLCEHNTYCISAFGTARCVPLLSNTSDLNQCPSETFLFELPHLFDPIRYDLYSACWPCGDAFETECVRESN